MGSPKKGLKGDTVVDLAFKFRIGGDLKPFLKHQAFKQQQRFLSAWISTARSANEKWRWGFL
jgi:hypothetical protein